MPHPSLQGFGDGTRPIYSEERGATHPGLAQDGRRARWEGSKGRRTLAPSRRVPPPHPSPTSSLAPHPAHLFGSDAVQVAGVQYLPQLGPDCLLHLLLLQGPGSRARQSRVPFPALP